MSLKNYDDWKTTKQISTVKTPIKEPHPIYLKFTRRVSASSLIKHQLQNVKSIQSSNNDHSLQSRYSSYSKVLSLRNSIFNTAF